MFSACILLYCILLYFNFLKNVYGGGHAECPKHNLQKE